MAAGSGSEVYWDVLGGGEYHKWKWEGDSDMV